MKSSSAAITKDIPFTLKKSLIASSAPSTSSGSERSRSSMSTTTRHPSPSPASKVPKSARKSRIPFAAGVAAGSGVSASTNPAMFGVRVTAEVIAT